jgi:hypothetical protein
MSVPANPGSRPSVTFLLCVESGYIEGQIGLAVEAIRRFGGRLADAPVIVVTPRWGPSLTGRTRHSLDLLGASYVRKSVSTSWNWYVYMNKALAAALGEELATTDQVIWLDSDCLVVSEPTPLLLEPGEDIACCSVDKNVGSSGPDDPYEAYWKALADHYGMPLERLPWVVTAHDRRRVRFRLHSGVYSFRRGSGTGKAFVEDMDTMLSSRVAFSRKLPYPGDDVALAFSIVRRNLRWRLLPMSCNYEMTPTSEIYRREEAPSAQVLHFHHALAAPEGAAWFLRELESFRPDVASWLRPRVPLATKTGGIHRAILRRLLRNWRARQQTRHEGSCKITVGG